MNFLEGNRTPITGSYHSINPVSATGITLDTADKRKARMALIKAEAQPVRWRDDGSNPTAGAGFLLDVGEEFTYTGSLNAIKFIDTAAGASTVHICLYR